MPVMRAGVFAIIEFCGDRRRASEAESEFNYAVFGWDVMANHGLMTDDRRLAIGGWRIDASLSALHGAVFESKGGNHAAPLLAQIGPLKVVREKEFFLFGDRLGRNGRQLRSQCNRCDNGKGSQEKLCVHECWD